MAGSERGIYPRWGGRLPVPGTGAASRRKTETPSSGGNPSGFS